MFSGDDLLDLIRRLALVAADNDNPLKSLAKLLYEQYIMYLNKKLDNLDDDTIKPNYFTAMLNNVIGKAGFDSEKICLMHQDLKEKQQQHTALLEEDNDLPERLRTEWNKQIAIHSSSQKSCIPTDLKSGEFGIVNGLDRRSFRVSQTLSSDDKIGHKNPANNIKKRLKIIDLFPEEYIKIAYNKIDIVRICGLIKNPEGDVELKELSVSALARLGEYFFGEQAFIEDKKLQETLIDYVLHEKDAAKKTRILRALKCCHPNCFISDEHSILSSIVTSNDAPIEQRYYAFRCLKHVFYSAAFSNQIGAYIIPIIDLLTLKYHQISQRDQEYLRLLQLDVVDFLIKGTTINLTPFLRQSECIQQLIETTFAYHYNESEELVRASLIAVICLLFEGDKESITKNTILQPSNLNLFLDFLPKCTQSMSLEKMCFILRNLGINSTVFQMLFEKGITLHLLTTLSDPLLSQKTKIQISAALTLACSEANNLKLCIEHNVYIDILNLLENIDKFTDEHSIDDLLNSLRLFVLRAHSLICQDEAVVSYVVDHLNIVPKKARENLLFLLYSATQSNSDEIKLKSKTILESIVPWLKTDKPNRMLILHITAQLLKLMPELISHFVQCALYDDVKGLLYVSDIKTVRLTVCFISKIITHPDVADNLLSSPILLLQLRKLLTRSEDKLTQEYAALVCTEIDLQEAGNSPRHPESDASSQQLEKRRRI